MVESDDLPVEPDTLPKDGIVFCFLNADRPCTAECMGYKTTAPPNAHLDPHQKNCVFLQSAERGSRSLNAIASILHNVAEVAERERVAKKNKDMDEQRKFAGNPPQDPRGTS